MTWFLMIIVHCSRGANVMRRGLKTLKSTGRMRKQRDEKRRTGDCKIAEPKTTLTLGQVTESETPLDQESSIVLKSSTLPLIALSLEVNVSA